MSDWRETVGEEWVREIAKTACLQLTEEEIISQTAALREMLAALDSLADFDARELWRSRAVPAESLREDAIGISEEREALLSCAPDREGVFFRAPRALRTEGGAE